MSESTTRDPEAMITALEAALNELVAASDSQQRHDDPMRLTQARTRGRLALRMLSEARTAAPVQGGRELVQLYRETLYPGRFFPIDIPCMEVEAAERLLTMRSRPTLERLFRFVAADQPRGTWRGWCRIATTVTAFLRSIGRIEEQALGLPEEELTFDAGIVHQELDRRLQAHDPGLALAPPTPDERAALNALVAKHGRDRVRVLVRMAFERDHWKRRVRDVDTLISNAPALLSDSADIWKTCRGDLALVLDPVPVQP